MHHYTATESYPTDIVNCSELYRTMYSETAPLLEDSPLHCPYQETDSQVVKTVHMVRTGGQSSLYGAFNHV